MSPTTFHFGFCFELRFDTVLDALPALRRQELDLALVLALITMLILFKFLFSFRHPVAQKTTLPISAGAGRDKRDRWEICFATAARGRPPSAKAATVYHKFGSTDGNLAKIPSRRPVVIITLRFYGTKNLSLCPCVHLSVACNVILYPSGTVMYERGRKN